MSFIPVFHASRKIEISRRGFFEAIKKRSFSMSVVAFTVELRRFIELIGEPKVDLDFTISGDVSWANLPFTFAWQADRGLIQRCSFVVRTEKHRFAITYDVEKMAEIKRFYDDHPMPLQLKLGFNPMLSTSQFVLAKDEITRFIRILEFQSICQKVRDSYRDSLTSGHLTLALQIPGPILEEFPEVPILREHFEISEESVWGESRPTDSDNVKKRVDKQLLFMRATDTVSTLLFLSAPFLYYKGFGIRTLGLVLSGLTVRFGGRIFAVFGL